MFPSCVRGRSPAGCVQASHHIYDYATMPSASSVLHMAAPTCIRAEQHTQNSLTMKHIVVFTSPSAATLLAARSLSSHGHEYAEMGGFRRI